MSFPVEGTAAGTELGVDRERDGGHWPQLSQGRSLGVEDTPAKRDLGTEGRRAPQREETLACKERRGAACGGRAGCKMAP